MLGLALVMVAIALPDSINPSLILTDIYLAAGPHALRRTAMFALAVFAVTALGGVAVALGLADLVSSLLPKLGHTVKDWLFVAGGVSLGLGATAIWVKRRELVARRRLTSTKDRAGQSAIALGAGIAGVELLTAFPYFAAIGIVAGSSVSAPEKALPHRSLQRRLRPAPDRYRDRLRGDGRRRRRVPQPNRRRATDRCPFVVAPLATVVGLGLTIFGVLRLAGG